MKRICKGVLLAGLAAFASGCGGSSDVIYRPYPQILPQHVKKLAVQPFVNKTEFFGLEDRLTYKITDALLRDGRYPVVSLSEADGIVMGEIRRYVLIPIQYDAAMVPTVYKLDILLRVRFYDKNANVYLWEEPAFQGVLQYSAASMPGGMSENDARESIWDNLSQDIVKRVLDGFGAASSASERTISGTGPQGVNTSTGTVRY